MKKFSLVALLLSLGFLATACNKTDTKKTPDAAPMTDKMDTTAPPTDTPPADPAK